MRRIIIQTKYGKKIVKMSKSFQTTMYLFRYMIYIYIYIYIYTYIFTTIHITYGVHEM